MCPRLPLAWHGIAAVFFSIPVSLLFFFTSLSEIGLELGWGYTNVDGQMANQSKKSWRRG